MKRLLFALIFLIFFLNFFSQNTQIFENEYIVFNRVKTVSTKSIKTNSSDRKIELESVEKFDSKGNLIYKMEIAMNSEHFIYYDSLNTIIREKIIIKKIDSLEQEYKSVYKNGKLTQWIHTSKKDTLFYFYDENKLVLEKFITRQIFDKIFGSSFNFLFFNSSTSYLKQLTYDKNKMQIIYKDFKTNNKKDTTFFNKTVDIYFFNNNEKIIQKIISKGSSWEQNYYYKYKKNKLVEMSYDNNKYLYKYNKGVLKEINWYKIKEGQEELFQTNVIEYEFW